MDVREAIRTQPMRAFQIRVIAICLIITVIDGFEILVMAFVAPFLAKAWHLSQVEVGYLLSASIFGSALGAVIVSPIADRIGRRLHTLACLALITLGMAASVFVQSVSQMVAARAFTGLFIGGIVASMNILVTEYSSNRRRGVAMGIYGIGFPLGASLGGFASIALMREFGWRAPFIMGAVITAAMFLAALVWLPESVQYLSEKRPAGALEQYNRIADKLGYARSTELPAPLSTPVTRNVGRAIFSGIMLRRTVFLWLGYACLTASFYFANTWTAKLVADLTKNPAMGSRIQSLVPLGGVIGALVFAALAARLRPRIVASLVMFFGTGAYLLYATMFTNIGIAPLLAILVGMAANGGIAAFYAISPPIYPTAVRASGVGLMIGFGRGVSILAPIVVGYLLANGLTPRFLYQAFAGVLVLAGLAVLALDRTYLGRSENPETPHARAELETEAALA